MDFNIFSPIIEAKHSFEVISRLNFVCIASGQTYFSFCDAATSSKSVGAGEGRLTGQMMVGAHAWVCVWGEEEGGLRLIKEPGSHQRRGNEMAFDLVECWRMCDSLPQKCKVVCEPSGIEKNRNRSDLREGVRGGGQAL